MLWRAGPAPRPLPPLLRHMELVWGEGGVWWAGSCLGTLSGGGGLLWQVNSARWNRAWFSQRKTAPPFRGLEWRPDSATYFGISIWRYLPWVNLADLFRGFWKMKSKQRKKSKLCIFCRPVISHHRHCNNRVITGSPEPCSTVFFVSCSSFIILWNPWAAIWE